MNGRSGSFVRVSRITECVRRQSPIPRGGVGVGLIFFLLSILCCIAREWPCRSQGSGWGDFPVGRRLGSGPLALLKMAQSTRLLDVPPLDWCRNASMSLPNASMFHRLYSRLSTSQSMNFLTRLRQTPSLTREPTNKKPFSYIRRHSAELSWTSLPTTVGGSCFVRGSIVL